MVFINFLFYDIMVRLHTFLYNSQISVSNVKGNVRKYQLEVNKAEYEHNNSKISIIF